MHQLTSLCVFGPKDVIQIRYYYYYYYYTLGIIIIIIIPVLRIDGQAHGPVELRRDDVIEDVLRTKSCHGDPVVERVRPIDARRQPVDGHAIHLRRYAGINCV